MAFGVIKMRIAVCGIGRTGIVAAVVLCELGHSLFCFDINPNLSESIQNICDVEPGLKSAIDYQIELGNLHFISNLSLNEIDAVFITIPIKEHTENGINLSPLLNFFKEFSPQLHRDKYTPFFIKTTLPVGTSASIASYISQIRPDLAVGTHYDVIYNPKFIREGSAIHDFMVPNRLVFGLHQTSLQKRDKNTSAKQAIDNIFLPLKNLNIPFLYTNYETSEMIKSATMGLVTVKMAYMNELETLCRDTGIDLKMLLTGIGSDRRISNEDLAFNAGIGGSSLPSSARLLIETGKNFGSELSILSTALISNGKRVQGLSSKILQRLNSFPNKEQRKASILGISIKPFSDDIIESPSIAIIRTLLSNKINVSLYDPYYLPKSFNIKNIPSDILLNEYFSICDSIYDCVTQSDTLVVMTCWPQFRQIDVSKLTELMNSTDHSPVIFDCNGVFHGSDRNIQYVAA